MCAIFFSAFICFIISRSCFGIRCAECIYVVQVMELFRRCTQLDSIGIVIIFHFFVIVGHHYYAHFIGFGNTAEKYERIRRISLYDAHISSHICDDKTSTIFNERTQFIRMHALICQFLFIGRNVHCFVHARNERSEL